jgi:hypothetical protein
MALAAKIDSLEAVAEAVRGEYIAGDGSPSRPDSGAFYLDVTAVGSLALEDTAGLKATIQKLRKIEKDATASLKAFEGLDAGEARDALARKGEFEAAGSKGPDVEARLESQKRQLTEMHANELKAWGVERGELEAGISDSLIDSYVSKAIGGKGSVELLLPVVKRSVRVVKDENGKRVARVFGSDGVELISQRTDANGAYMGVEEHVESLRSDSRYAPAFHGSGPSGGGEPGTGSHQQIGTQNNGRSPSVPNQPSSPIETLRSAYANKP